MKMRSVLFFVVTLCATAPVLAGEVHVSTRGDDANPGTASAPLATLHAAKKVVRAHIAGGLNEPVHVLVHPGVYELSLPLELEPADSGTEAFPVTWRAADPEKRPVLCGGSVIRGTWRRSHKPGIWYVDLSDTMDELGQPSAEDGTTVAKDQHGNFRQLFVDGRRATRARFPNADEPNPFMYATGGGMDHVTIDPNLVKTNWGTAPDAQLNIVVQWMFFNQWNTVTRVNPETGRIDFADSERHGRVSKGNWFWIEGVFEELDQPGEWYLNRREGRLYYMPEPGGNPNEMAFVAPRLNRLVYAKGEVNAGTHVEHVHFDGLEFRHTAFTLGHIAPRVHTDAAVILENTADSSIRNCHFENIGGYAVWLHLDSQRNTIDRNTVLHSGGGGVLLTGARLSYMDDSKVYTPGEAASKVAPILNRITRNTVKHCGKIRYYGGGVHLDSRPFHMSMMPGNYIAHNHFQDLSRNGVFAFRNQGGNVLEYNHIHDCMKTTIDGACIHFATMNHLNAPNHILNNWLHDIWGFKQHPDGKPQRVLANGVFLDWDTSNTTVKDNYVYNAGDVPIKVIWQNWNVTNEGNQSSKSRIVPPFVDQVGPEGTATHGIDLQSNRLIGNMIHYANSDYVRYEGAWEEASYVGLNGLFVNNYLVAKPDSDAKITYTLPITESGQYDVCLLYIPGGATNAQVLVDTAEGRREVRWNLNKGHRHGFAVKVGTYAFEKEKTASVTITSDGADGPVKADAVAFVKVPTPR
jgi:hypothetical protein